ncbi:hypothetical protein [Nocardia sp. NPDC004604]|uniref:AMP-binding enzyme n=1 Tax=Nocardia sp. NPDC004604 TaxID=3157013 RepID=UPI0033A9AC72
MPTQQQLDVNYMDGADDPWIPFTRLTDQVFLKYWKGRPDRAEDLVESGGERISSVDLMAHPAVAEAAVVAVSDEQWGERPLANSTLKAGARTDPEELREHLATDLARWQLPERVRRRPSHLVRM